MLKILCDTSHSQTNALPFFGGLFRRNLSIKEFSDDKISYEKIADADSLIVSSPIHISPPKARKTSELSLEEAKAILNFVEEGKGLVLLSSALSDKKWTLSLNRLIKKIGVSFDTDLVKDDTYNTDGLPEIPIIQKIVKHNVTWAVNSFSYPRGCSLCSESSSFELAFSSSRSYRARREEKKESFVVLAACEHGKGRVVLIGSALCFDPWFLEEFGNRQLLTNILEWVS